MNTIFDMDCVPDITNEVSMATFACIQVIHLQVSVEKVLKKKTLEV